MTPEPVFGQVVVGHETCHHLRLRLSCDDFNSLLERCQNRCEICEIPGPEAPRGKLFLDHDHRYGLYAIRGLICARCNVLMRLVDNGKREDLRATTYVLNSWFMWRYLNPPGREGPLRDPRVFGGWEATAQKLYRAGLHP